jgi:hypothetical protein
MLLALFGCSDSTAPEAGASQVSVTGDITESWEANAYHGISTYSSFDTELEYFTIALFPKSAGSNLLAGTLIYKFGAEAPGVGTYDLGGYAIGDTIPAGEFGGGYSGLDATNFAGYTMTGGSITFIEVTPTAVRGEFDMSGHYTRLTDEDSSRVVNVSGTFVTTEAPGQ